MFRYIVVKKNVSIVGFDIASRDINNTSKKKQVEILRKEHSLQN